MGERKRVLVGCERSAKVRNAFLKRGCNAYSCDLLPLSEPDKLQRHLQCNILDVLYDGWDLLICHPPCTHLAVSGARWFDDPRYPNKRRDQAAAIAFVKTIWAAPIKEVCIENPIGVLSTQWMKPTQIIDPTEFGHSQTKATCLWLRNLPLLLPPSFLEVKTEAVQAKNTSFAHHERNQSARSVTFDNIAYAMAKQWAS